VSSDGYIFAVNPLSNSVSMFAIYSTNATAVTLVGSPQSSYGDFPNSVTAYGQYVCVVTTGATNGIYCYTYDSTGLTPISGSWVSLGLNLTTPPISHMGPGQISFTPDGSGLIVVVKGFNPPVYIFSFSSGSPGQTPATSASQGSVNFAFVFSGSNIILVDAAPYGNGSGLVALSYSTSTPSVTFTTPTYYLLPGQQASCWVSWSSRTGYYYVSNAAAPASISTVSWSTSAGFSDLGDYPIGTNASVSDSAIISMGGQDYLFANDGGLHRLMMYTLSGTTLSNPQQSPRNDMGGSGVAGYVLPSSTTTGSPPSTTTGTPPPPPPPPATSGVIHLVSSVLMTLLSLVVLRNC